MLCYDLAENLPFAHAIKHSERSWNDSIRRTISALESCYLARMFGFGLPTLAVNCNHGSTAVKRVTKCFVSNLYQIRFYSVTWFQVRWVPEVFLACGGNFRCWPKSDTSLVVGRSRERQVDFKTTWQELWPRPNVEHFTRRTKLVELRSWKCRRLAQ